MGFCFENDQFVSRVDFEISPGKLDSMDPFVMLGSRRSVEEVCERICIPAPKTRTSACVAGVFFCIVAARASSRSEDLMCCRTRSTTFFCGPAECARSTT